MRPPPPHLLGLAGAGHQPLDAELFLQRLTVRDSTPTTELRGSTPHSIWCTDIRCSNSTTVATRINTPGTSPSSVAAACAEIACTASVVAPTCPGRAGRGHGVMPTHVFCLVLQSFHSPDHGLPTHPTMCRLAEFRHSNIAPRDPRGPEYFGLGYAVLAGSI